MYYVDKAVTSYICMLSRLKEWVHSYHKLPNAKGILKDPNIPDLSTYVRHF